MKSLLNQICMALSLLFFCGIAEGATGCEVPYSYEELKDMTTPELYKVFCPVNSEVKSSYKITQVASGRYLDIAFEKWQSCFNQEQRLERILKKRGERMFMDDIAEKCGQ